MEDSINIAGQILEAVHFAALKHKDQRRKDPEKTPYINHPIGVAYILWKEGGINDTQVLQVSLCDYHTGLADCIGPIHRCTG